MLPEFRRRDDLRHELVALLWKQSVHKILRNLNF